MARLSIFIDGNYLEQVARAYNRRVDFRKLAPEITNTVSSGTFEPLDLLRTYYYDCLPYQSDPPTEAESRRFAAKSSFFRILRTFERFEVREGRLAYRGMDSRGQPIFQQKRTDLLLGLDFAMMSVKGQISHAAVIAGDSDFPPAFEAAKQEGVSVWLFHGPGRSTGRESSYAEELWQAADVRYELTMDFFERIKL